MAEREDYFTKRDEVKEGLAKGGTHADDAVGQFYITFTVIWTLFICGSLIWLYSLRNSVAVRIRNFWLIASAVLMLNLYEITVLIRYPMGDLFTCTAEYWIMSIILPLGIALFQASNIQLLSYYEEQQFLVQWSFLRRGRRLFRQTPRELFRNWKTLSTVHKTYVGIFIGAVVQVVVTVFLYFGSRVFHKSFGFFGPKDEGCVRAYEWIPSIIWQFLWAYGFGPYILYRIRSIRDTHHWALQTRLAIIASLPGSPMWLIFRYVSTRATERANKFSPPAIWIVPGLMVIQLVSIFVPIYDAKKIKQLRRKTSSLYSNSTTTSKSRDQYSMSALETQINEDVNSLLVWTSKREFTAENVVFLKAVRDFKRKWTNEEAGGRTLSTAQIRQRYEEAGLIFFNLINPNTARFNINIDSVTYRQLESAFSALALPDACPNTPGSDNLVCPWNDDFQRMTETAMHGSDSETNLVDEVRNTYQSQVTAVEMKDGSSFRHKSGSIKSSNSMVPATFNMNIFDRAYASIRYLVFTNSWVKFVDSQETTSVSESFWSSSTKV